MRLALTMLALLILAINARAAANIGRAGGMAFSCDVNTRKCTFSGVWDGRIAKP